MNAVLSLNALYGCEGAHQGSVTRAQDSAVRRIARLARTARQDFEPFSAEGAARQLLGAALITAVMAVRSNPSTPRNFRFLALEGAQYHYETSWTRRPAECLTTSRSTC